jgi:tRNA threonylcarbamoyladenosine biosynthesis protein TsaB
MALILCIETSTSVCSAALHRDGNLLRAIEEHKPQSAAAQLAVQIDQLFTQTGLPKKKLDAVAVSAGPGSYTGLRIGVATAKGICFALDVPLIGLDSLQVLAASIASPIDAELLCPMIDARRMEVYTALFDLSLKRVEQTHARIIDQSSFVEQLSNQSIAFFGNGADKCKEMISHPGALFLEGVYPCASRMGNLSKAKYDENQFEDLNLFEPNYLKAFVAKTKSA